MLFPNAGTPPTSIGAYVEDMLNELADLADRINESGLAASIRHAGLAAANVNAREWLKLRERADEEGH